MIIIIILEAEGILSRRYLSRRIILEVEGNLGSEILKVEFILATDISLLNEASQLPLA